MDHASHLLGLRLNDWTCLIVFSAVAFYPATSRRASTEPSTEPLQTDQLASKAPAP